MRLAEGSIFVGLAIALHVGLLALNAPDGQQAAGSGGDASITLTGATGSIAAMVEDWQQPPDVVTEADTTDAPMPEPAETRLAAVETAPTPSVIQSLAIPDMASPPPGAPDLPQALAVPMSQDPELALMSEPSPPLQPPRTPPGDPAPLRQSPNVRPAPPSDVEPQPQVAAPPPSPLAPRHAGRPHPRPEPVEQREQASRNSTATAAQPRTTASGAGGGSQAGQSGQSEISTLSPGEKASLIATWASQVQSAAQRELVYPRKAQRQRMTGRPRVQVTLDTSGRLISVSLAASSGNPLLDRAALQTMQRVGRFPDAPQALPRSRYSFRIPVVFQ